VVLPGRWQALCSALSHERLGVVGEADRERLHEQHQRKLVRAYEHAASVHDHAAEMHRDAAKFFDEHDETGKADRERDLADREAQAAEVDRRRAAAEVHHPDMEDDENSQPSDA
jgi:hypothetical protein